MHSLVSVLKELSLVLWDGGSSIINPVVRASIFWETSCVLNLQLILTILHSGEYHIFMKRYITIRCLISALNHIWLSVITASSK